MKQVIFKHGDTAQNDAYTGLLGEITIDVENMQFRLHDGVTQGGRVFGDTEHVQTIVEGLVTSGTLVDTLSAQTLTNKTLTSPTITGGIKETTQVVASATSSFNLTTATGTIKKITLTGNTTVVDQLMEGESVTLMVRRNDFTLTFPTVAWVGGAEPTLPTAQYATLTFWKIDNTLYGSHTGDV